MQIKTIRNLFAVAIVILLSACGSAHIRTDINTQNSNSYKNLVIEEVRVYSNEAAARNNKALQEKMAAWETYSRNQLKSYAQSRKYNLIESTIDAGADALLVDLDVNVQYGNRALRWAVGFGAGKGSVNSILTFKDAKTGEVKFQAKAESDLSMGAAGGDIDGVLKQNVQKLIEQHRNSTRS